MSGSLITIIVSTYNRVSALRWCLEALEAQALRDFEVIVVNDGSTNSTAEELQAYARTTPLRLRIFSQQNAGPALGRNLAITHTTTPFALLIGNDILAIPTLLEEHLRFHRQHPQEDQLALGWTRWGETHQRITPFMRWYEEIQFDNASLLQGATTPPAKMKTAACQYPRGLRSTRPDASTRSGTNSTILSGTPLTVPDGSLIRLAT